MRSILLVALAGVVVAAAPVASAGASSAARETKAPCIATPVTIKANSGLALCGPATAVVHAGGKTYTYAHGFCATLGKIGFQLSLGTSIPMADGNAGKPYFSVDVDTKTLHASGFAYFAGKKAVPAGVFKLAGQIRSRASFSGSNAGGTFSGTWNCHGVVAAE